MISDLSQAAKFMASENDKIVFLATTSVVLFIFRQVF